MYWSMTPLLDEGDAHLNRAPVQVCDPEVALLWVTNTRGVRGVEGTVRKYTGISAHDVLYHISG